MIRFMLPSLIALFVMSCAPVPTRIALSVEYEDDWNIGLGHLQNLDRYRNGRAWSRDRRGAHAAATGRGSVARDARATGRQLFAMAPSQGTGSILCGSTQERYVRALLAHLKNDTGLAGV